MTTGPNSASYFMEVLKAANKGLAHTIGGDIQCVRTDTEGPRRGSDFEVRIPLCYPDPNSRVAHLLQSIHSSYRPFHIYKNILHFLQKYILCPSAACLWRTSMARTLNRVLNPSKVSRALPIRDPSAYTGTSLGPRRTSTANPGSFSLYRCESGPKTEPRGVEEEIRLCHGSKGSREPAHSNCPDLSVSDSDVGTRLIRRPKRTRYCGKIIEEPQYLPRRRYVNMGGRLYCVLCKRRLEVGRI